MKHSRYRLQMSVPVRLLRVLLFSVLLVVFVLWAVQAEDPASQVLSLVGVATSLVSLRTVVGPVVVVRPRALRVVRIWPLRREIPWYRILEVDLVPGYWVVELELNSGEKVTLPVVERVDDLYEEIERHRQLLDA
ncbi:MAG: PH domain-containing protein [Acidimicrobiales bacterium]|nr:PH domain-containing protein [Acidimicrobiales bacterium]